MNFVSFFYNQGIACFTDDNGLLINYCAKLILKHILHTWHWAKCYCKTRNSVDRLKLVYVEHFSSSSHFYTQRGRIQKTTSKPTFQPQQGPIRTLSQQLQLFELAFM